MRAALVLVFLLLLCAPPAHACRCDSRLGPRARPALPWIEGEGFPTNAIFTSALDWHDAAGRRLPLVRDEIRSAALGIEVRVSAAEIEGGAELLAIDVCPAIGECEHVLRFAEGPDLVAPSRATLSRVVVHHPEGGASPCRLDLLELEIAGTDDATPREDLFVVLHEGATAEEATSVVEIAEVLAFDPGAVGTATIALGGADGHLRDGGPLRSAGRFCVAAALVDRAGNVGPRSEPVCLDTTDPRDPHVVVEPWSDPCASTGCTVGRASRAGAGMLALGLVALGSRRRRRSATMRG